MFEIERSAKELTKEFTKKVNFYICMYTAVSLKPKMLKVDHRRCLKADISDIYEEGPDNNFHVSQNKNLKFNHFPHLS